MHERPTLHKRMRFLYPLIGPFRYIKKQIRNIYFRSAVYQNDVFCRAKMAQMNLIALTKILQDHDWFIDWCKEQNLLDKTSSTWVQQRIQLDKSFIARRVWVAMLEEWLRWNGINHGFMAASFSSKRFSPNIHFGAQIYHNSSSVLNLTWRTSHANNNTQHLTPTNFYSRVAIT